MQFELLALEGNVSAYVKVIGSDTKREGDPTNVFYRENVPCWD